MKRFIEWKYSAPIMSAIGFYINLGNLAWNLYNHSPLWIDILLIGFTSLSVWGACFSYYVFKSTQDSKAFREQLQREIHSRRYVNE